MNAASSPFSDELNRRRFVSLAAKSFLGVSILPWAGSDKLQGAGLGLNRPLNHAPKAKNVIYLYMSGGMTHLDTFDPKPGTETGGPTKSIKTNADGIRFAENLPLLANHADKVAVVRGMTSTYHARGIDHLSLFSEYMDCAFTSPR